MMAATLRTISTRPDQGTARETVARIDRLFAPLTPNWWRSRRRPGVDILVDDCQCQSEVDNSGSRSYDSEISAIGGSDARQRMWSGPSAYQATASVQRTHRARAAHALAGRTI